MKTLRGVVMVDSQYLAEEKSTFISNYEDVVYVNRKSIPSYQFLVGSSLCFYGFTGCALSGREQ